MVEIDIDFCLGIRLYGLPRKQNVEFFSCGQHSKNNFSALEQGHRNGIERIQGWFLNTGQNGKLYFALCHTWRHAGVKASLWIYSVCVCALQSWISLFGADSLQVSGFFGTWYSRNHIGLVGVIEACRYGECNQMGLLYWTQTRYLGTHATRLLQHFSSRQHNLRNVLLGVGKSKRKLPTEKKPCANPSSSLSNVEKLYKSRKWNKKMQRETSIIENSITIRSREKHTYPIKNGQKINKPWNQE